MHLFIQQALAAMEARLNQRLDGLDARLRELTEAVGDLERLEPPRAERPIRPTRRKPKR